MGKPHHLERLAIECTDEPSRLANDSGTILKIVPPMQLQSALGQFRSRRELDDR
jgi:hypothetical protein